MRLQLLTLHLSMLRAALQSGNEMEYVSQRNVVWDIFKSIPATFPHGNGSDSTTLDTTQERRIYFGTEQGSLGDRGTSQPKS